MCVCFLGRVVSRSRGGFQVENAFVMDVEVGENKI